VWLSAGVTFVGNVTVTNNSKVSHPFPLFHPPFSPPPSTSFHFPENRPMVSDPGPPDSSFSFLQPQEPKILPKGVYKDTTIDLTAAPGLGPLRPYTVATQPIAGQKPGTSGLRKKVRLTAPDRSLYPLKHD
jgi:hypothetical protein